MNAGAERFHYLLVAAPLYLALAITARAAEIKATVREAGAGTAKITVEGDVVPNPGDKAEIFFKLPGSDEDISVATARVEKVEGDSAQLKIESATGDVAKGQLVRISSTSTTPKNKGSATKWAPLDQRLAALAPEYAEARQRDDEGNYDAALALLNTAIDRHPKEWKLYYNRARCHSRKGDWDKCIADLDRAIALGLPTTEDEADTYCARGYAEGMKGNYLAAFEDQTRAIDRHATAMAYHERARDRLFLNQWDENLVNDCNRAIALDPNDGYAYYIRGHYHFRKGSRESALADFGKAAALDPSLEKSVREAEAAVKDQKPEQPRE